MKSRDSEKYLVRAVSSCASAVDCKSRMSWNKVSTKEFMPWKLIVSSLATWALSECIIMDEESGITQNQPESESCIVYSSRRRFQ